MRASLWPLRFLPWLEQHDLPDAIGIAIRREVLRNGRSRVFINDAQATVSQLRELGSLLVSLHKQDDVGITFDRPALSHVLDVAGNHSAVKTTYLEAYRAWVIAKPSWMCWKPLHGNRRAMSITYSTKSTNWRPFVSHPRLGDVERGIEHLQHAHELHEGISLAANACDGGESGGLHRIEEARRALANVQGVDKDVDEAIERLLSVRIELQDLTDTLWQLQERKQPDPNRLGQLESTHDAVVRAMRKHQVDDPEGLMSKLEALNRQLQAIGGLEESLTNARAEHDETWQVLETAGAALSEARRVAGEQLTALVLPKLNDLKMPHARMAWEMPRCAPDDMGMEAPEIWFASNPGSPLLPLTKVASGGERSRFMLALKSVLARIQSTPVIVLDEIDTGVSGEVAMHMGRAMKEMAQASHTQQVLSVTHLPQVAAQAEHHWEVQKTTDGASTHVQVVSLKDQQRHQAIATMLSGENVTSEALGQAKQLMASS